MQFVLQMIDLLKENFGKFWIFAEIILLIIAFSTTKKILKTIAFVCVLIGLAVYVSRFIL